MACSSTLTNGRALPAGILGSLCVLLPQTCFASGPTIDLEVVKTKDADDCPDAAYLAEATSRVLGRGVLAPPSVAADLRVEIRFDRQRRGLYIATVRASLSRDGGAADDRSFAHEGATCAALADAVVAALAVRLDEEEAATEKPAPSPSPAPPRSSAPTTSISPAPANPDDSPPPGESRRDLRGARWYGWQVLAADASSVAVIVLGGSTNTAALSWLGIGGVFLASPIVHGFHDRWGATAASFGMRLGLAVVGGVIGASVAPPCNPPSGSIAGAILCGFNPLAYGFLGASVGLGVASAVDVIGLSWEHTRVRRTDVSGLRLTPLLRFSRAEGRHGGGTVGIAGEF